MMICSKIIIHWLICLIVVVAISSAQQHRCSNNYQVVQGGFGCNNRSSRRLFSDTPSHRIVTLRNGARVRGKLQTSIGKREMYFYKSLRYAEVFHRFGLAEMARPWLGIYDATFSRGGCPQGFPFISRIEDCLHLNIWQPVDDVDKLKPVIVYLYGSGFHLANINLIGTTVFDGSHLADTGDMIVVTVQSRLGAFGFLYAGTDRAPGNQGVHDLVLSLRWIQENIERFGGDPRNVTVFGVSSGSMSISAMILSPLAKGLFQRAIMRSGSVSEFLPFSPENSLKKSLQFAERMKCPTDNMDGMVDCLQNKTVEELTFKTLSIDLPSIFEGKKMFIMFGDKAGILPDRPSKMLAEGIYNAVDLISGFSYGELGTITAYILPELINGYRQFSFDDVQRLFLKILKELQVPPDLIEPVFDFYTKNLREYPSNQELRRALVDLVSDGVISCPTYLFTLKYAGMLARNESNVNNVYSYRFDHFSPYMMLALCFHWMGPCHAVDVPIMIGWAADPSLYQILFKNSDRKISKQMMKVWTNFAKYGQPGNYLDGLEWPQFRSLDRRLGNNRTVMAWKQMIIEQPYRITVNSNLDRCLFWEPVLFPDDPYDHYHR